MISLIRGILLESLSTNASGNLKKITDNFNVIEVL